MEKEEDEKTQKEEKAEQEMIQHLNIISYWIDSMGQHQRSYILDSMFEFISFLAFPGNTFQKRRVSSPAPVTIVSPDGFIARKSTLLE